MRSFAFLTSFCSTTFAHLRSVKHHFEKCHPIEKLHGYLSILPELLRGS
jgi:hypothetical protein